MYQCIALASYYSFRCMFIVFLRTYRYCPRQKPTLRAVQVESITRDRDSKAAEVEMLQQQVGTPPRGWNLCWRSFGSRLAQDF